MLKPTSRLPFIAPGDLKGGAMLIAAGALVGSAIWLDGPLSRAINGVAVLIWVAAAVVLARSLRFTERRLPPMVFVAGLIVLLVLILRPGDLVAAGIGFALGGSMLALVAPTRGVTWALLLAAAWLPVHIVLRVAFSLLAGSARVRTEPPPTSAFVPLVMILAAFLGALFVILVSRRGGFRGTAAMADATPVVHGEHRFAHRGRTKLR